MRNMIGGGKSFSMVDTAVREPPTIFPLKRDCEVLTRLEIEVDLQLDGQLVMLLGCSAGSGVLLRGDEPASLAQAFLHAGASNVIAPLWDLDIHSTRAWAESFARAWAKDRQPAALAAREAACALQRQWYGPERYGALTLRGDWL